MKVSKSSHIKNWVSLCSPQHSLKRLIKISTKRTFQIILIFWKSLSHLGILQFTLQEGKRLSQLYCRAVIIRWFYHIHWEGTLKDWGLNPLVRVPKVGEDAMTKIHWIAWYLFHYLIYICYNILQCLIFLF